MDTQDLRKLGPWVGIVTIFVANTAIIAATIISPSFSWTGNALSNLGEVGEPAGTATTATLFNGGLILGGIGGIVFAFWLASQVKNAVGKLGSLTFAASMISMAGVGVYTQNHPYHFYVASAFFLLFSVAAIVMAVGLFLAENPELGLVSAGIGVGNLLVWFGWGLTGPINRPGLAIPELLGTVLIVAWVLVMAFHYKQDRSKPSGDPFEWGA